MNTPTMHKHVLLINEIRKDYCKYCSGTILLPLCVIYESPWDTLMASNTYPTLETYQRIESSLHTLHRTKGGGEELISCECAIKCHVNSIPRWMMMMMVVAPSPSSYLLHSVVTDEAAKDDIARLP